MSGTKSTISKVFENVNIAPGVTYWYSTTNGNDSDFTSFSVNSSEPSILSLKHGWFSNDNYQGTTCKVTLNRCFNFRIPDMK